MAHTAGPAATSPSSPVVSISPNSADHHSVWIDRTLAGGLLIVIACGLLTWLILSIAHYDDRFEVNLAPGSWIAQAHSAREGVLYPLPVDGEHYAGTRYMPLFIVAHTAVSRFTDELLISGKLVTYASALAMLAAVFGLLRQRRCPLLPSMALTMALVVTPGGVQALNSIRGDVLALALQLWALLAIGRPRSWLNVMIAALLCGLAALTKMSAVWAAAAIALWLLLHHRAWLMLFIVTAVAAVLGGLAAAHIASDGRAHESLFGFAASGIRGWWAIAWWSPPRLFSFFTSRALPAFALMPCAILAVLLSGARRQLQPLHLSLFTCFAMLWLMYADIGVGGNHIIDLAALSLILTGELWAMLARGANATPAGSVASSPAAGHGRRIIAAIIIWHAMVSFLSFVWSDVREAAVGMLSQRTSIEYAPVPLADVIQPGDRVLSEDPFVPIAHGQRPVVSDSFMLARLDERHPERVDPLIERIRQYEFDKIVLFEPADPTSWRYAELLFGPRVMRAVAEHYALAARKEGFWVYVPMNMNDGRDRVQDEGADAQ